MRYGWMIAFLIPLLAACGESEPEEADPAAVVKAGETDAPAKIEIPAEIRSRIVALEGAALTGETPSLRSAGVTIAPDVRTAAEDDPVIIPGSIRSPVIPIVRRKGKVRNLRIIQAAADSIRPICCTVFINIIALKIIRMVSR